LQAVVHELGLLLDGVAKSGASAPAGSDLRGLSVNQLSTLLLIAGPNIPAHLDWLRACAEGRDAYVGLADTAFAGMLAAMQNDVDAFLAPVVPSFVRMVLEHLKAMPEGVSPKVPLDTYLGLVALSPEIAFPTFQEFAPVVVGWFIDPSTNIETRSVLADAIGGLEPFWNRTVDFSITLLESLFGDILRMLGESVGTTVHPSLDGMLWCFAAITTTLGPGCFAVAADRTDAIFLGLVPHLSQVALFHGLPTSTDRQFTAAVIRFCEEMRSRCAPSSGAVCNGFIWSARTQPAAA
jgi:hypothetical protein